MPNRFDFLNAHKQSLSRTSLSDLFENNPNRFDSFSIKNNIGLFDFSKNLITEETLSHFQTCLDAAKFDEKRSAMINGKPINTTENRAVMHMALRSGSQDKNTQDYIDKTLNKIKDVSNDLRNDSDVTDVIHIGIGGSDLGPKMVVSALAHIADGPRIHYLSNIDGHEITGLLATLDSSTTAVIVVSKSFKTLETLKNAEIIRKWAPHAPFYAVTENASNALTFGIDEAHIIPLKNWIGGRFSLWGAAGISIAIALGFDPFKALLSGAQQADTHFMTQPLQQNIPMMMGCLALWYHTVFQYPAHAVVPYIESLSHLPAYLQQLDMESNGKAAPYPTGAIIFGGTGTNVQHAFFQHLHQSPTITPVDFILNKTPAKNYESLHQTLNANAIAQAKALADGRTDTKNPHRHFPGNRPSNTFILNDLTPETLGYLIALYEHKVFVNGVLLGINSFDQFGVELGKTLAQDVMDMMDSEPKETDSSTQGLISFYKA